MRSIQIVMTWWLKHQVNLERSLQNLKKDTCSETESFVTQKLLWVLPINFPTLFPKLLTSRLQTILSTDYDSVIEAFSHERKWSFRINTLKWDGTEVFLEFEKKWIKVEKFEEVSWVYFFDRKDDYTMKGTDAFYSGKIYLQSLSSMLPVLALDPQTSDTILDVCAAPWSKTTQIAMMMKNEGKIVALEQNQIRYDKLMHNAVLQWATIIEWVKMDAKKWLIDDWRLIIKQQKNCINNYPLSIIHYQLNRVLLDAPCSAEGRISLSNEKTYGFWSLENIQKKAELQYDLLSHAFSCLKVGGTLVYSTCTLAPEENEWVISRFLEACPDAHLEPIEIWLSYKSWWRSGITSFGKSEYGEEMKKVVRILPSDETEGFFLAKVKKV